jgi:hypothetical protein
MRVEKFDDELVDALRALGFTIADDKETATIKGDVALTIIRPAHTEGFDLDIDLPNGRSLHARLSRAAILRAVD